MVKNIYKELLLDCPIPYAHMKVLRDENMNFKAIEILEVNASFENTFDLSRYFIKNKYVRNFVGKEKELSLYNFFIKVSNGKYSVSKFSPKLKMNLNLEIYNYDKDEYHIRFSKISNENYKLSELLRKSAFVAWIKDRNGNYIDINNAFLELVNMRYDDVIGKNDEDIWDLSLAQRFKRQDLETIKKNGLYTSEDIIYKDNRIFILETGKWPYMDEENKHILGTIGVSIDVSDRVRLKEAIRKNEENFIDIANNVEQLIIIRDEKKAVYVSPYFEELYGFKPDELYEDMNNWYKYWDKIEFLEEPKRYSKEEPTTDIFRVVKNGKIDKWIKSRFVPIFDEKGKMIKKVGMIQDITDKKKLDEQLEDLRLEFFANLSHELRTPINLIMSAMQVIHLKLEDMGNEKLSSLDRYLNIISQNSFRLLKLVNNLIDTTKIDSGNFDYSPTNQDIIAFVENICMSVVDFVERNNLEIVFDTDIEENVIGFDLDHMERIILNLISNAIKFNKENGKIEVNIYTSEEFVNISVKDEGVGIPKEKLESVFGRFEQVNKKMKKEREGSGIGLALVKSLVEMHGGSINLKSVLGQGSEFIVAIPNKVVSSDNEIEIDRSSSFSQINTMDVEFSDIYC